MQLHQNCHYPTQFSLGIAIKFRFYYYADLSKSGIIHLVRSQIFGKTNISYPLIRTRNVSFSENFANVLSE